MFYRPLSFIQNKGESSATQAVGSRRGGWGGGGGSRGVTSLDDERTDTPSPRSTLSTVQGPVRGLSLHARPLFVLAQYSAHFQGRLTAFRLLASFGISCFFSQGGVRCDRYIKRIDGDRWLHGTRRCCVYRFDATRNAPEDWASKRL